MVRALFIQLILSFFALQSAFAGPSLVSFLSQKTNEIRNLEQCPKAHAAEAVALASNAKCTPSLNFKTKTLSHDEIAEQIFFDAAAKKQIAAYQCVSDQARELQTNRNSPKVEENRNVLAQTFTAKLAKLHLIHKELEPIEDELAGMDIKQSAKPMGEVMPDTTIDQARKKKLQKRRVELLTANEVITQSLWQGGNHLIRKRVQAEIKKKNFNAERFSKEFFHTNGPQSFDALLGQIRSEAERDKLALIRKADSSDITSAQFRLNDKEKVQLFRDQNWINSKDFDGLSCRLDGRYGTGRERFYFVAETASAVGLTLIPGGFYLAATRGLIALSTARTLTYVAATGFSVPTLATAYENKCMKSALKTSAKDTCASPSSGTIQSLEDDSCLLDVALAALDVPFPELKSLGSLAALGIRGARAAADVPRVRNPQLEIWLARESGRDAAAEVAELEIRNTLAKGPMKVTSLVGEGQSGAMHVTFENGVEGIWKPSVGRYASGKSELAVDKIDRFLSWDIVPATMPRSLSGIEGTVQLRVTNLKPMSMMDHPPEFAYFDFLIGNGDRHNGNFLITENNRLAAIDHGTAFLKNEMPKALTEFNKSLEEVAMMEQAVANYNRQLQEALASGAKTDSPGVKELRRRLSRDQQLRDEAKKNTLMMAKFMTPPKEVVDRLRRISRDHWKSLLRQNLSEKQIDELVVRQKAMLQSIDRSQSILGTAIFTK